MYSNAYSISYSFISSFSYSSSLKLSSYGYYYINLYKLI